MILDFNELCDSAKFCKQFEKSNIVELFDLKNVKILKDLYIGEVNDVDCHDLYYVLLNKGLVITKYDTCFYIVAGTVCEFDFVDDKFNIIIDNEYFNMNIHELEDIIIDVNLTDLGQRCIERDPDIENIFTTKECLLKLEKFLTIAPKFIVCAFTMDELYEYFKSTNCINEECEYANWIDDFSDVITNQLRDAVKSANNNDIEGPDDTMISIYKYADSYSNNNHQFDLKGRLVCCFYSEKTKIKVSELRKLILAYKFNKIDITDVDSIPDTSGSSLNGIYSSDKMTYIECRFKMSYLFDGDL